MIGVAPAPASPGAAKASSLLPTPSEPFRTAMPSDFPAALGPMAEADLPIVSAGQPGNRLGGASPAARPSVGAGAKGSAPSEPEQREGPAGAADEFTFDLPQASADLPVVAGNRQVKRTPGRADLSSQPPDLPVVSADLPTPTQSRSAPAGSLPVPAPRPPARAEMSGASPGLPVRAQASGPGAGLPALAATSSPGLPARAHASGSGAGLPTLAASGAPPGLPERAQASAPATGLPSPFATTRSAGAGLPVPRGGARDFGEIDLPLVADSLPLVVPGELPLVADTLPRAVSGELPLPVDASPRAVSVELPLAVDALPRAVRVEPPLAVDALPRVAPGKSTESANAHPPDSIGGFGEIDLPREMPPSSRSPSSPRPEPPDPDEFQLEEGPRPRRSGPTSAIRHDSNRADGGMGFGEVDLGSGAGRSDPPSVGMAAPAIEAADALSRGAATSWNPPAPTVPVSPVSRGKVPRVSANRKPSRRTAVVFLVVAAFLVGGAALQLTPYGAYGYLVVTDLVQANEYARRTAATMKEVDAILGADTYDSAKRAVARSYQAHAALRRAKPLTAYAALVDAAVTVRFGADASRASRANQLIAELPADQEIKYRDVAVAAQAAERGDLEKAAKALEAAGRRGGANDPVRLDAALLGGEVALAMGNPSQALAEFTQALSLSNDARAHFGLARAHDALGEAPEAKKEIEATLAASPGHTGALTLRARRQSESVDPGEALADLATVIDGPVRSTASPAELSDAYAARAWILLERGKASEARDAFGQAVKLNPSDVGALNGEGRLLLSEGRYAEALARFDTALGFAPNSPSTIANDAEGKLALERLADAKQQLVAARERFPNDIGILLLLGKVEKHLGNDDAAEVDLRSAITHVDPTRVDAVQPYVALCELLSARGRVADARATLDEAKKKLPESSALDRAFGAFDEMQGDYEGAIAQYRAAIAKDAKEAASHFRLAVILRRLRRFDEASSELDKVAAVDRDYPGLLLERGLLFEDSGEVARAIDQFKTALSKAPEDPDLQLRVGSAYVAIGRADDALPMLRKVLDKRPGSAEANHYMGRALMLGGAAVQGDALRYLRRAADLDPHRAEFHVYVAWAANEATPAQLELARREVDKAIELDKLSADAYWQRGILERMEGAIDDAIKDEKHALELRPTRYEAHATLAECYGDKNDEAGAISEWQRAIAGDGDTRSPDGLVRHPYWHYRYGQLLAERGGGAAALAQLLSAVAATEKMDVHPAWLAPLEFLSAEALRGAGKRSEAIEHYQRFLDIAPQNSPDRYDAERALKQLGQP